MKDTRVTIASLRSVLEEETVTLTLEASRRKVNHAPERNRRLDSVARPFRERQRERSRPDTPG